MAREITNTSASVHARLLNVARGSARPFSDLLQAFAMERFLCRLARTPHADRFVLKGAMLMRAWDPLLFRTTMDIDLLARVPNSIATLERIMRDACDSAVEPDGIRFDPTSVQGETIIEDADYSGIRLTFVGMLGKAPLYSHIRPRPLLRRSFRSCCSARSRTAA
ncbi:MAG: nucleotidyl transferase AbiEii/AbiGii toxin family protein [Phycisphaerales bacterium]|nr:nucleotidyl transferase AbiEii/AbiGii toxin family protein [Phycisphaerales bacterium]